VLVEVLTANIGGTSRFAWAVFKRFTDLFWLFACSMRGTLLPVERVEGDSLRCVLSEPPSGDSFDCAALRFLLED
jgi:hypothetical protein